ncbi:hypothetical protein A8H39_00690 [Paraburkholderia fungorum]|uniref:methylated-DNA--[protein]-cysteine S-methyltransferase n=1 Tax=Paraburkholderia fungorum TaxID=134537 RepID=UPI0009E07939|nr:hypothetical protein A8H39_00690 [Paraburkholderia fungorum]
MVPGYAFPTPLGTVNLRIEDDYVTALELANDSVGGFRNPPSQQRSPRLCELVAGELQEYLEARRRSFTFPFYLRGTPFQRQVWNLVYAIPYGCCVPYQSIAVKLGVGRAGAEDVRVAIVKNPIAIVIPCHRVRLPAGTVPNENFNARMALRTLERADCE